MKKEQHRFSFIPLIKERKIDSFPPLKGYSFAQNSAIDLGEGFHISIQASSGNYCEPRVTVKDLSEYSKFEILIMYEDKYAIVVNEFMRVFDYAIHIPEDEVGNQDWTHMIKSGTYIVDEGCPVAGYVDGEIIESIIKDLKSTVIRLRSRNVLFEKTRTKYNFFKLYN